MTESHDGGSLPPIASVELNVHYEFAQPLSEEELRRTNSIISDATGLAGHPNPDEPGGMVWRSDWPDAGTPRHKAADFEMPPDDTGRHGAEPSETERNRALVTGQAKSPQTAPRHDATAAGMTIQVPDIEQLLTPRDVATLLQCSLGHVRDLRQRGEVRAVKDGRNWRFEPREIRGYLDRHRHGNSLPGGADGDERNGRTRGAGDNRRARGPA
jgi:excisionase family DNA binding protein